MYRKILVPVDGSELSECALAHVEDISTGCKVDDVIVLSVVEPVEVHYAEDITFIAKKIRDDAKEGAQEYAQKYVNKVVAGLKKKGVAAKAVVVEGRAADSIVDYAKKNGVDLIIMSTHGRTGPSRWVLGSVAEKVVTSSPAAVLLAAPVSCRIS